MMKINLVVLHGWGHNQSFWKVFRKTFKNDKNIDVITLDLPGFGKESVKEDGWGVPEYAEWVVRKIMTLGLDNVVLLGHSFGGRISSLIASSNPKWLRGVVLYGSPSLYRPSLMIKIRNKIAKTMNLLGISLRAGKTSELLEAEEWGLGKTFRKIVNYDQENKLPMIKKPTLILWGEHDKEVPLRVGREMNTLIGKSKLTILEGLGHNAHLENPTLFYGTIKRFVENL